MNNSARARMATVALILHGLVHVDVDAAGLITSEESATATWNASRTELTIAGNSSDIHISGSGGNLVVSSSGNITFGGSLVVAGRRITSSSSSSSSSSSKRARTRVNETLDAGATIGRVSASGQATLVMAARALPASVKAVASGQASIELASLDETRRVTISASGQSSVCARMPPSTTRLTLTSSGQASIKLT